MELGDKQRRKVSAPGDAVSVFIQNLRPGNSLKARFNGLRSSGQSCYDGTTVLSNSGKFNIADTYGAIFACFYAEPLILINKISHL